MTRDPTRMGHQVAGRAPLIATGAVVVAVLLGTWAWDEGWRISNEPVAASTIPTTTTTKPAPTTTRPWLTTTTLATLVESPFTEKELAFLNALVVITEGGAGRYFHAGVDTDGDGFPDRGWHEPEVLEPPTGLVVSGRMSCDAERAEYALSNTYGAEREFIETFILVARAWLC